MRTAYADCTGPHPVSDIKHNHRVTSKRRSRIGSLDAAAGAGPPFGMCSVLPERRTNPAHESLSSDPESCRKASMRSNRLSTLTRNTSGCSAARMAASSSRPAPGYCSIRRSRISSRLATSISLSSSVPKGPAQRIDHAKADCPPHVGGSLCRILKL